MQIATVTGNVGRDPETRYTQSGKEMMRFSVASRTWIPPQGDNEGQEKTEWWNVTLFSPQEYIKNNLAKGTQVTVTGEFIRREYPTRDGGTGQSMDFTRNVVVALHLPKRERSDDDSGSRQLAAASKGNGRSGGSRSRSEPVEDDNDLPFAFPRRFAEYAGSVLLGSDRTY